MDQFATLDELNVGVVTTFQPNDADLVGYYLYNKVFQTQFSNYKTFPEICIYGENGLPPWEIWRIYQESKFPHQDFIYFFSRAEKMNPNKTRNSRKVGTDGYTWSATEIAKPVYVDGVQGAFGSLRKFRYEKNTKDKKGKKERVFDEHHGAWLMEEFTINSSPDLALCRLKVNDKGGDRNNKRKSSDVNLRIMKKQKLDEGTSITSQQMMPSSSIDEDTDQVAQVVQENSDNNFYDEIEQILMSDDECVDDENITFSPTVLFNQEQYSDCLVAPQQQLEPAEKRCQEEYQVQLPQQDQASSSHYNEQQLLSDNGFDISWDDTYLQSDEFINRLLAY